MAASDGSKKMPVAKLWWGSASSLVRFFARASLAIARSITPLKLLVRSRFEVECGAEDQSFHFHLVSAPDDEFGRITTEGRPTISSGLALTK